jgi:NAD(P)H dehydrogenase (quinone)
MILVTGANGRFGRPVVEHLLRTGPAAELAVSVRDPAAAQDLADRGVSVRHGDFNEPDTLEAAFAGADTVLVNSTNYGTAPADRARQQAAALDAAAGRRVVLISWVDLDRCPLAMATDFPQTERRLISSTKDWTILRMTYGMAESLARDVTAAMASGTLSAPAARAGAVPAAGTDLAEAAALVLRSSDHNGQTLELTGPDRVDWDDLAALSGRLAGRPVAYRPVDDPEFQAQMLAAGWPPVAVAMLLDYYAAFRAGWAGQPRPDLGALLGRRAVPSIEAVARVC